MDPTNKRHYRPQRVALNDDLRRKFASSVFSQPAPVVAKRFGLPYLLAYNIINGRVSSITERHYRLLFGEDPPERQILRVTSDYFRDMVELWLYLNDDTSKLDLYGDLFAGRNVKRPDYRVFTGHIKTVPPEVEHRMEQKFLDSGIDRKTMLHWIQAFRQISKRDRVPYRRIRPHLLFLHEHIDIHPNAILHQQFNRYESGRLKSVARNVSKRVEALRRAAEKALSSGQEIEIQRLRESVYGPKAGYKLYAEVAEELHFLIRAAGKGPKRYLGRTAAPYEQGKVKRIAVWRAEKIQRECRRFLDLNPDVPIRILPRRLRQHHLARLFKLLFERAADILSRPDGVVVEQQILMPSHRKTEYEKEAYGFTLFDKAPRTLGMRKKAFDLMVARNCDIFRQVGRYTQHWYLSDLYLKELSGKRGFNLISAKYELLAVQMKQGASIGRCVN